MDFQFVVSVSVNKTQGKFSGREMIAEAIQNALDEANPDTVYLDESTYEVSDWSADEQQIPRRPRVRKPRARKPTPATESAVSQTGETA